MLGTIFTMQGILFFLENMAGYYWRSNYKLLMFAITQEFFSKQNCVLHRQFRETALTSCAVQFLPNFVFRSQVAVTLNLINAPLSSLARERWGQVFIPPACLACDMKGREEEYWHLSPIFTPFWGEHQAIIANPASMAGSCLPTLFLLFCSSYVVPKKKPLSWRIMVLVLRKIFISNIYYTHCCKWNGQL